LPPLPGLQSITPRSFNFQSAQGPRRDFRSPRPHSLHLLTVKIIFLRLLVG
jgi:hypothetical protein